MDANSRWPGAPGPADASPMVESVVLPTSRALAAPRTLGLRLPLIDRRLRAPAILVGGLLLVVLFAVPARVHLGEPTILAHSVVDEAIPFLDWTIWIYATYYPFLIAAVWLTRDDRLRSDAVYGMLLASGFGLIIFTLWPTAITREDASLVGATGLLWRLLFSVDTMVNALPSMHVAHTCLAAVALASRSRPWRIIASMWAALIILSTLTTKQHYAIDVPGGFALAALCFILVRFGAEYWRVGRGAVD
ncbi:MAG TPA: phosphatase PAP2 family protein [Candidatus Acidoferrum sp.]|nr:phosphatase PAP2 family protein [Candidatus Acidoferrum sp.]